MPVEQLPIPPEADPAGQTRPEPGTRAPSPALAAYLARMRRQRRWYLGAVAALIAGVVVLVSVVMSTSEIAHAHLHTTAAPPPAIQPGAPAAAQTVAWTTPDTPALSQPVWSGTVVTYSAHTVTGRDGRTGAATWTYTRTDATVCQVAQSQGKTMAFYSRNGDCDEIDAFDTRTGARAWSRTLFSNGMLIVGHPTYQVSQLTVLLVTDSLVQAIDPSTGYDRWHFAQPAGCHTDGAALGTTGVLIGQRCGDGDWVLLRDAYAGDDSTTSTKWRVRGPRAEPVAASDLIAALDVSTGTLLTYDPAKGTARPVVRLTPRPASGDGLTTVPAAGASLVFVDGTCYSIGSASGTQLWSQPLTGPPTLAGSQLIGPTAEGVRALDPATGATISSYPVRGVRAGSTVYPIGSGFVLGPAQGSAATGTQVTR